MFNLFFSGGRLEIQFDVTCIDFRVFTYPLLFLIIIEFSRPSVMPNELGNSIQKRKLAISRPPDKTLVACFAALLFLVSH